jgi:hypothetical protein
MAEDVTGEIVRRIVRQFESRWQARGGEHR